MSSKVGKRLHPFDHVRLRPDTYIGSIVSERRELWVCDKKQTDEPVDEESEDALKDTFNYREIDYNEGFERCHIELLSNAIDNKWRSEKHNLTMKKIAIELNVEKGYFSVWNDGYFIPCTKEDYSYKDYRTGKEIKELLYPAETFFGEMLAGTNFEEDNKRKTSGRNGMGAKLANAMASKFIVEHADPDAHKMFVQEYTNGGKERTTPEVTSYRAKTGYTKITFYPDFKVFGIEEYTDDLVSLLRRHAYDSAALSKVPITFNGEKIVIKDFAKYTQLYYPTVKKSSMIYLTAPNGDECVIVEKDVESDSTEELTNGMPAVDPRGTMDSMSFINGIHTREDGIHVDAWKRTLLTQLVKSFNERKLKKGESPVKAKLEDFNAYLAIFVRAEIDGAKFGSQSKHRLTGGIINDEVVNKIALAPEKGAVKKEWSEKLEEAVGRMMKWKVMPILHANLDQRSQGKQAKKEGKGAKKRNFGDKYQPANWAGTKNWEKTCLVICEGSSAMAFARRLFNGQFDEYGIYAVRGKFINVRKASKAEISKNVEVQDLMTILGISRGTKADVRQYKRIMIMTDADDDGIHINGLLQNFFYGFWPEMYDEKCVYSFSTAVVVVKYKNGKEVNEMVFFSNPDFDNWSSRGEADRIGKVIETQYYKGLGTHKPGDEIRYLDDPKIVRYILDKETKEYMELGFDETKGSTDWRKTWMVRDLPKPGEMLIAPTEEASLLYEGDCSLSRFVDEKLIVFFLTSLVRGIPNMYDGFKESQRKAFFGISKDPDVRNHVVTLEDLIGSIKKITGYHHGAKSLEDTCKKLAQGFVGSNNIPVCVNAGEFGTRAAGGLDAAASRYIKTKLEDITHTIFSKLDEPVLEHAYSDNKRVEYKHYMPILPMILVNGADGVACGFSTEIPTFNPEDIVKRIRAWLNSPEELEQLPPMKPWFRGFKGDVELEYDNDGKLTGWMSKGILTEAENGWWDVTELPIGLWTNNFSEYIQYLHTGKAPPGSKKKDGEVYLKKIDWVLNGNTVHVRLLPTADFIPDMNVKGNMNLLKKGGSFRNMVLLDENNYPRRYGTAEEILADFCEVRLKFYTKRKSYWLKEYEQEKWALTQKHIFVKAVVNKKLDLYQEDQDLEEALRKLRLEKCDDKYDYLLSMQARSFTKKKVEELEKEIAKVEEKIAALQAKSERDLWNEDLDVFEKAYATFLKTRKEEADPKKRKGKKVGEKSNEDEDKPKRRRVVKAKTAKITKVAKKITKRAVKKATKKT